MRPAVRLAFSCLLVFAALGAGCKREKQSLILAELRLAAADPAAANLTSVRISTAGAAAQTYPLTSLDVNTATTYGLYVDSDVVGPITVDAVATPPSGCPRFVGQGYGTIAEAGGKVNVPITLQLDTVCPTDGGGGAGGLAGAGGGAGRGGTGGQTPPGQVPSLTSCRTFDHVGANCPTHTQVLNVAISPDGQTVATGGDSFNDKVRIWRFDGRTLTATGTVLDGHSHGLAFSPDGSKLAAVDATQVRMWNTSNWTAGTTLQTSSNSLVGVAFTPNGQRVISADHIGTAGGNLYVHAVTGNGLPMITQHVDEEPSVLGVSPSPASDGSVGVVVGTWNGTAQVFALGASGFTGPTKITTNTVGYALDAVSVSPDGSLFVTSDQATRFWAFPAATPVAPDATFGDANGLAFSPDGRYLAAAGTFDMSKVSLIAVSNHGETARYTPPYTADSIVFSPSGTAVIGGLDDCGKVFVCSD